jgi:CO/xanthine dehydrogenase FAD-binding subunit
LGNAAPRPARVPSVEAALSGQVITDELVAAAVTRIGDDINPATDNHATADYRRKIAPSLVGRLVRTAILRAKGAQA